MMSTRTLLSSSSSTFDRYFFRSHSNNTRTSSKTKSNKSSSSQKKRYKFSSSNTERYPDVYKFSANQYETRSHSSDSPRYYFSLENTANLPALRSSNTFEGSSTHPSNTPYLFSTTKDLPATSTFPPLDDTWAYKLRKSYRVSENDVDSSLRVRSTSPKHRQSTRMDTVTSTNGALSIIKRSPTEKSVTVQFESSLLSPITRSYLNEARERLSGRQHAQSSESFEKSVDRLVSSVNQKYRQHPSITSPSETSSSSHYISQYYAKEDERSFESDDEEHQFSYKLNINRTHRQIMKTVNRSLIDRAYHGNQNRLKHLEQNVHRYLRLLESQSLERELNYDLIRCFSSSYLQEIRQEEFRQDRTRIQMRSYTYEDIQDIHIPSILEAYKMRVATDREKRPRSQSSIGMGQLSPVSSSGYSPLMVGSLDDNMDTHSGGFQTERRSRTLSSQISPTLRPNVDVFYEIMQESFHGVDASIAGHISKASRSHPTISDVEIKSNFSLWPDDELADQNLSIHHSRKSIPNQRKISRYLSAVNRSLLDRPSDLITDFYLSQLNHNMQESVRHMEILARDKAYKQEFLHQRTTNLGRSLSAEHLYQVRKEHIRYKQLPTRPTSFTTEDVADIYKPFTLENYKRKIAIELERRRRERQGQSISTSTMYTSETDLTPHVNEPVYRPQTSNDFILDSPPVIVQTREIIMGRARRILSNDGSSDVVHHVSGISPPSVFATNRRSVSATRTRLTITVEKPDFIEHNRTDESHVPSTKICTHPSQINTIQICRANRIESDSDNLAVAHIEAIVPLNQYQINSITDQSFDEQMTSYTEDKPQLERSTLIIPLNEHVSRMHEDIPITEVIQTTNISIPPNRKAHEISGDSGISLNVSCTVEPPTVFHSPYIHTTTEPLPEIQRTVLANNFPYIDPLHDSHSPALLFDELSSATRKQHATEIIDDHYYWRTCDKVEQNARIPIIVYNTEWSDEQVEDLTSNIQNAHYADPENLIYEQVTITPPVVFAIHATITPDHEQVTSLPADSCSIGQSNVRMDQPPNLENPLRSINPLTFHYPQHSQNHNFSSSASSLLEMETFLNNFEESIDHEQHLPFVNQISVSYAASFNQLKEHQYRSLPIEWFEPTLLPREEQLVEQWTVENQLDTIQPEGTLYRQQVDFLTNTECENVILASATDAFCINERFENDEEKSNHTTLREHRDMISHCSPTSDYETDSVDRDNETLIIPLTILPSSSVTSTTLLSQSSPLLTSHTTPIAPIVYFLDVLALEGKEKNSSTKDFLLTIGFGQHQMNEISNTVATTDQPQRPTWINRSLSENIEILPASIHEENESISPFIHQRLHFATEHQLEDDETALLIHPYRLQFGHNLEENTQAPLSPSFQPAFLHLPMVNETYKYQRSFHTEFPSFSPSDTPPDPFFWKIQENEILPAATCQINRSEIFAYAQINYSLDNREEIEPIAMKLDQPMYIEHYHVQSLFPFPETCYAESNELEILTGQDDMEDFLSNFILTKPSRNEGGDLMKNFKEENPDNNWLKSKRFDGSTIKPKASVGVRPATSPDSGPIYEDVKIEKHVHANMGPKGKYEQRANYTYESEDDRSINQVKYSPFELMNDPQSAHVVKQEEIYVPKKIVEPISEDEKSTSSEEVVFEEWTEEFNCRRTDEYDQNTNRLLRTTIDETSDRIKGDVLKEQYKEKNTRVKRHKSYDVVKEVHRRIPENIYEEVPRSPPSPPALIHRPLSRSRQWTSEDIYTTEFVEDPTIARELESTAQKFNSSTHYERVRPREPSPVPLTTQTNVTTYPTARYDRISSVVTPSVHFADQGKQEPEEVVSEEYQVEVETTNKRDRTSDEDLAQTFFPDDRQSPTRRTFDWRNEMKELYSPPSDAKQHKSSTDGNYLAQRASVISSGSQLRSKEVQIKLPGHEKTPPERRKFHPSLPSRHAVKEVLVCVPRASSLEKPFHPSSMDENEQRKKKTSFRHSDSPKKENSTSPTKDDQPRSSSIHTEYRRSYEPTFNRVGELRNTFETTSTTRGSTRDDATKYQTPISTGFTEQRRRIFEDQESTRRPINEFQSTERRISETHTTPSLVTDRVSRIESIQTPIDIKYKSRQVISSIDTDLSRPSQPIHQSTPKSYKQKCNDDAGHESEDELSDPRQDYDSRRQTSKTRLRDFSQSTPHPVDVTHTTHPTTSDFDQTKMENVLSHVPSSKGKGMLIELSPRTPSKSHFTSDSGIYDYSSTQQLPTSSPTWRQTVSTTIVGDTIRSHDNSAYIDSTMNSSPYDHQRTTDADHTTLQNVDESPSPSTFKYDREIIPNQYHYQPQHRTVRRQLTNSPPNDYENLISHQSRIETQGKVPITTQSRTIKPLVVDEYETVETETQVECQVQRTNEMKESTKTERVASPLSPSRKLHTTITTTHSADERTPTRRVLLNDRPQYYEPSKEESRFQPIQRDHSPDELSYRPSSHSHTMEVTSLSPTTRVTFEKHSPNEIIAIVRVPGLPNPSNRHETTESTLSEKPSQESPRLHYQRVHATSYRPPLLPSYDQQRPSRSRTSPFESTNGHSSPINFPIRSASSHTNFHEQNQQQQQQQHQSSRSQTRYYSGSLGNLFSSNLEFEIEIEKRPPQKLQQPTSVALDQASHATVTTSKDGRVSVQNIVAYPGNTVVINSDFHSSDRSLNRSSGYFSSDEPRSQGHTANYSSDEQNSISVPSPIRRYPANERTPISHSSRYDFNQVNDIVKNYSQPSSNFDEAIDQIDALYNNLDVQTNGQQTYDFSKLNRRKQLTQHPNEYSSRYTSTGFQQIPSEQSTSSLTNLVMATPIRPVHSLSSSVGVLTDYDTPGSVQNIVQQNRLNGQSQIVQRNRTSVKQMKQKNAVKRRNGNIQGRYSDEDGENESPLSDNGRSQPSPRSYHVSNHHQ